MSAAQPATPLFGRELEAEQRPEFRSRMHESSPAARTGGYEGAMKAIVQEGYGAPERVLKLEEVDRPPVGDDDVLIRVRTTSMNTPDWITVTGVPCFD